MGQEIASSHFNEQDFAVFAERLKQETELLAQWFRSDQFDQEHGIGGFELEAWLIDQQGSPAPLNQLFLQQVNSPLVVPELAQFNVEVNGSPQRLEGGALQAMADELSQTWQHCCQTAQKLEADLVMIGILPSISPSQLTLEHISPLQRYYALNEQVMRLHQSQRLELNIQGSDHLQTWHSDIMVESATTSFQIHLQVAPEQAVRFYNAAQILSAPMVAATANSPYLFGQDLWEETRIPLFEQAVDGQPRPQSSYQPRVTFGSGYLETSLLECFHENLQQFPVLLPTLMDTDPGRFAHLRLHNGTLWRWNRPLIGFGSTGQPHLRIEHRVVAAGPSLVDMIANAALFYGLVHSLGTQEIPPESQLSFAEARTNFYTAARKGLQAEVTWLNRDRLTLQTLFLDQLIPLAWQGLTELKLDSKDIDYYLKILEGRVRTGRNGATWQRAYVAKFGKDMQQLTRTYLAHQQSGAPVHEWDL